MRNLALTIILLASVLFVEAQQCLTDHNYEKYKKAHPEQQAEFDRFEREDNAPLNKTNGTVRIIPVVFHVIHEYGEENISKAQIDDAIAVLNQDFRKKNADTTLTRTAFKPFAVDFEIEFRLARIDPNGNCTEGIDRIYSTLGNNATDAVKSVSWWPNTKYLNIWVVKSIDNDGGTGYILGYAQFPNSANTAPGTDGVVVRHDCVGRIGTGSTGSFREYRTLTHEVGHYLGLFHTFQGGCSGGDQVSDTPPVQAANYTCVLTTNTCNNFSSPYTSDPLDMLENYMDYSPSSCKNMYTNGQRNRANTMINTYRNVLVSVSNNAATGVDGSGPLACAPVVDFIAPKTVGCEGTPFSFVDYSYNGVITNWNWTFTGAVTSSSTSQNPTGIVWNTAGTYTVTLNASNAQGSNVKTRTSYVTILPLQAVDVAPVFQGFESATLAADGWVLENGGNSYTWQRITSSKRSGNAGFFIRHYNGTGTISGDVDAFYSKSYNFTNAKKPLITFYTAYAQRASGVNDVFRMYVSTDCGQTWQSKISKAGSSLAGGVAMNANNYVPAAADWVLQQTDLTQYAGQPNIRFRFETISREGNNLYIDDINIVDAQTGLNITHEASDISLTVVPNPFAQTTAMNFLLDKPAVVSVSITDMLGNVLACEKDKKYDAGNISLPITLLQLENLSGSVYYVTVSVDGINYTRKFVKL